MISYTRKYLGKFQLRSSAQIEATKDLPHLPLPGPFVSAAQYSERPIRFNVSVAACFPCTTRGCILKASKDPRSALSLVVLQLRTPKVSRSASCLPVLLAREKTMLGNG